MGAMEPSPTEIKIMIKQVKINNLWNQYEAMTGKGSLKAKADIVAKIRALEVN